MVAAAAAAKQAVAEEVTEEVMEGVVQDVQDVQPVHEVVGEWYLCCPAGYQLRSLLFPYRYGPLLEVPYEFNVISMKSIQTMEESLLASLCQV